MVKYKVILFCLSVLLFSCGKKTESIHPIVGRITESVYASGNIKAVDQYNVFSTVNGILLSNYAEAGDSVHVGDTICILDNSNNALQAENARLVLELSKENASSRSDRIQESELTLKLAKEKYTLDSSLFARQKRLWEKNIGSRVDLEQKQLNMQSSRASYLTAQARLSQLVSQLNNDLSRSQVNYQLSNKSSSDFIIRSAIDGLVFATLKEKGELITSQSPIAIIGQAKAFLIEIQVDENDITRVALGQKVIVSMDSHPDEVYNAQVSKIYPIMDERSRSFKVEALFETIPPSLFPNLTVEANIVIKEKENALTISRDYLIDNEFIMNSKKEKIKVNLGLEDYRFVEITEGIDSSTEIIKP